MGGMTKPVNKELRVALIAIPVALVAAIAGSAMTMGTPPVSTIGLVVAVAGFIAGVVGVVALAVGLWKRLA